MPVWTDKDGNEHVIADMTDQYLMNAIMFCLNTASAYRSYEFRKLRALETIFPEQEDIEHQIDVLLEQPDIEMLANIMPSFSNLLDEAEKRNMHQLIPTERSNK